MPSLPKDIKPQWLNVIRRIQSVARKNDGVGIINIKVMVNQDGLPLFWIEPEMVLLEPKTAISVEFLKKTFTEDELKLVLSEIFAQS